MFTIARKGQKPFPARYVFALTRRWLRTVITKGDVLGCVLIGLLGRGCATDTERILKDLNRFERFLRGSGLQENSKQNDIKSIFLMNKTMKKTMKVMLHSLCGMVLTVMALSAAVTASGQTQQTVTTGEKVKTVTVNGTATEISTTGQTVQAPVGAKVRIKATDVPTGKVPRLKLKKAATSGARQAGNGAGHVGSGEPAAKARRADQTTGRDAAPAKTGAYSSPEGAQLRKLKR